MGGHVTEEMNQEGSKANRVSSVQFITHADRVRGSFVVILQLFLSSIPVSLLYIQSLRQYKTFFRRFNYTLHL